MRVFHIISQQDAAMFESQGSYAPPSLGKEGFIHLSYAEQVCRVANFLYKGRDDLLLFEFSPIDLPNLVAETNPGGSEAFPHHYGELEWQNVTASYPLPCNPDGNFTLPELD